MNTLLPSLGQLRQKKQFILFFSAFFFLRSFLVAQPAIQWDRTFGGNSNDDSRAIAQTPDGGYIIGGSSTSGISGDKTEDTPFSDYWIVKIDAEGAKEWDKTFSNGGESQLSSILTTSDGGYLLGGSKGGFTSWIVKLDNSGAIEWEKYISGGEGEQSFGSMQKTQDGGYVVGISSSEAAGGSKSQEPVGSYDYWIVKLDAAGNILWDKVFGGLKGELLTSIQVTSDQGYIIAGQSGSGISGDKTEESRGGNIDFWILKLDVSGNKQWDKTIGGPGYEDGAYVRQTTDGGYILGGTTQSIAGGDKSEDSHGSDYWVIKLSETGYIQWQRSLSGGDGANSGSFNDGFRVLIQTSDGGYLVGGYSSSSAGLDKTEDSKGFTDMWVVKLDTNGGDEWDKTIGSSGYDHFSGLIQVTDGGYLLTGGSNSEAGGDKTENSKGIDDYWIVKLAAEEPSLPVILAEFEVRQENSTAVLTWKTTSETASDRFEVQHSLTGKSWNSIGTVKSKGESFEVANYQFLHTSPVAGANNLYRLKMIDTDKAFTYSTIKTAKFEQAFDYQVYPNPVSDVLKIKGLNLQGVQGIGIFSSTGRSVYRSGQVLKSEIDVKGLGAGLYVLKIWNTDGSEIAKSIVVSR